MTRLTVPDFLRAAAYKREAVERFLDPEARVWARFDPDVGYLLRNACVPDGLDGHNALYRYEPAGHRKIINFPDMQPRINTYGNSFTQCHQVSDGETWQEVLAAHFGEPIRNFGVGGHGTYHAWILLQRREDAELSAPYLILNMWGDDHQRGIVPWRWLSYYDTWETAGFDFMFHGTPWDHIRIDARTGRLVHHANAFKTQDSLFRLCDPDFVVETFRNDLAVHLMAGERGGEVSVPLLEEAADTIGMQLDFRDHGALPRNAAILFREYAAECTVRLLDEMLPWLHARDKRLLVLLSYPREQVAEACAGADRDLPESVDWNPLRLRRRLAELHVPHIDTLHDHVADSRVFRLTPEQYIARYYIGHYNPLGNHFFAHAIRDRVAAWLDPAPPAFVRDATPIRFEGYLPCGRPASEE